MSELIKAPLQGEVLGARDHARAIGYVHPFRERRIETFITAGTSIQEVIDDVLAQNRGSRLTKSLVVEVDGVVVPQEWWPRVRLKVGSTVTFRPTLHGKNPLASILLLAVTVAAMIVAPELAAFIGLTGKLLTVGTALISAAIITGGALAVNALFPISSSGTSDGGFSFTQLNSIQGANNQSSPFGPIPVVLGTHRQSPFYAAKPYTEIIGDDQYLRLLFVWGYGPIEISDLKVGETPLSSFADVEIETRQGFVSDTPVTLYPSEVSEQALSITLDGQNGVPGVYMADNSITYYTQVTSDKADVISIDITFPEGVYHVNKDSGNPDPWISAVLAQYRKAGTNDPWIDLSRYTQVNRAVKTTRLGASVAVTRGQYEVRVGRATFSPGAPANLPEYKDLAVWTALRSFTNEMPITFGKPLALTAVRIRASGQLNGVLNTFNGICKSLVNAYSGSGSTWNADTASQSPADLYRHVLQGPANARAPTDDQIAIDVFQDWWTYCQANGFKFNQVRTSRTSVYDCLKDIAAAGRATPTFIDGKWAVVWDRPDDPIVQVFTPRNSWGLSGAHPYAVIPQAWRMQFINEKNGYTNDERIVYDDGYDGSNATLYETIQFPGVTDPDLLWKHGRFHIAQIRLRPEEQTLNVGWENLVCTRGDRVRVQHDVLLIGQISGRVKAVSGQNITLDDSVIMESGKTYGIRFRKADEPDLYRSVDLNIGEHNIVTLSASGDVPDVGCLFAFGESQQETAVYRVKQISHQGDLVAQLTLVDDAPAISTADQGPIPTYNPNITIPPDPSTLQPQDLRVQQVFDGFGASTRALARMTWQVPRFGSITAFDVQYIDITGGGDWTNSGTIPSPTTTADVPIINAGEWGFRVRCLFANGTHSNWTTDSPVVLQGLISAPADARNFRWAFVSGRSELDWDPVIDPRGVFYELRKGASWDAALVIGDALAQPRFQTIGDDVYRLRAYVLSPFGGRIYSNNDATLSITSTVLIDNVVVSHDERGENWPGQCTNGVGVDQQQNFLRTSGATNVLGTPNVLALSDILNDGGQIGGDYYSKWIVNTGRVTRCRVSIDFEATAVPANADFLGEPSILDDPDVLRSYLTRFIRVYPIIRTAQAGPGDVFSEVDVFAPADVFTTGVTWTDWTKWSPDVFQAWLFHIGLRFEILDATVGAIAYALKFKWTVDVEDRLDRYQNLTVPPGGLHIDFEFGGFNTTPSGSKTPFSGGPNNALVPHVLGDILNAPDLRVAFRNVTATGMDVFVINASTLVDVGGAGVNAFAQGY